MSQEEQTTATTLEKTTTQETVVENSQTENTQDSKKESENKDNQTSENRGRDNNNRFDNRRGGNRFGNRRGGRRPMRREKPEFEQKIISLRRVTRVMAGGRRFSFSAAVVIGDRKGRVGFGIGKAGDTAMAIDKAVRMAKKDMITVKRTDTNSIPHDSQAKYKASEVLLRPVSGKGLAAGGAVRTVLEMAGVDEVGGKLLSRSKNNINNAKATLLALAPFTAR